MSRTGNGLDRADIFWSTFPKAWLLELYSSHAGRAQTLSIQYVT
jgi:hypothetical protein